MKIVRSGSSSYGRCWIEDHGSYFMVYVLDGQSARGPFSSLAAALECFSHYCA
jgi:hypothetical protein